MTKLLRLIEENIPDKYPCNLYKLFYNMQAVFHYGGDTWNDWNSAVRDMLVNAQQNGPGCYKGSWGFEGTQFHGSEAGRLLSTALCCLSLEVYYRYVQK